jgi:hypothetical protein
MLPGDGTALEEEGENPWLLPSGEGMCADTLGPDGE